MTSILIRPSTGRATSGASALNNLERLLARVGATMPNLPEVKRARKIIETERAIGAAFAELANHRAVDALAAQVIDGSLTVTQALVATAEAAASNGKSARELQDATRRKSAARTVAELAAVGDRWVTDVLRPIVTPIVEELTGMVDLLDKCNHRGPRAGHDDRETRDRWTRATDLCADLTAIHAVADELRNLAIIPASNRDISAEYRWGRLDKLGTLLEEPLAILTNIANGAEAGIFTEAETVEHVNAAAARRGTPQAAAIGA